MMNRRILMKSEYLLKTPDETQSDCILPWSVDHGFFVPGPSWMFIQERF